ncbi:amylo-alpha-1,6-glucosidase [Methanohalophilus mahii]|uniref:Glycogen debranching enzyme n=1 Tax=Methanohalophilus mahii (strain ATCC 35705 / DSM 5219 / SLP) TaxID=547558 RepID=D5EAT7_METMS|nr:amylo-alpha-1,6-glucosidase [Methanohalophilus mahii]ADE36288.1 glycogen debranching enzyme [Methanohalophilus mahii DSM 5219]
MPDIPEDEKSYEKFASREWIVTNGLGGYASSTVIGANTRKYHGLLIAALDAPVERKVILSSLDEELEVGGKIYRLASHKYPQTIHPKGFHYLKGYTTEPVPTFNYSVDNVSLEKQIFMVYGTNSTVIRYSINGETDNITMRLFPLVTYRNFHQLKRSDDITFGQSVKAYKVMIYNGKDSFELNSNMEYNPKPYWYYNFEYETDRKRGLDYQEDLYNPGYFEGRMDKDSGQVFYVVVTTSAITENFNAEEEFRREISRRKKVCPALDVTDTFMKTLGLSADSFIVKRQTTLSASVIAGYHWFADWGRDAMISLEGLTLVTGRYDKARQILLTFSKYCFKGLIPNYFPDRQDGDAGYNTVDASLWFVHAVGRYFAYTKDQAFVSNIWPVISDIIENYMKGTINNIHMDSDGLISHGPQLTWMDAKIGSLNVTPREGKACEINALWYNALCTVTWLAKSIDVPSSDYKQLAHQIKENFAKKYWNADKLCLYDCIFPEDPEIKDASVRPNQIFAISLPFPVLSEDKAFYVLQKVAEDLLTPYGLRTLSKADSKYVGKYEGDAVSRDKAYHNGTVWPWLFGFFISGYLKVHGNSENSRQYCRTLILRFTGHFNEAGIDTVSEVFDGDSPHNPGGCISQAWSVAEILRAYAEVTTGTPP